MIDRAARGRSARRGRAPAPEVVYEDDHLIVVDKPARLLSVATATERRRTLYALVFDYLGRKRPPERPFIVHRLDRDASGLIVLAKSERAKLALQREFAARTAGRTYVAVVEGRVGPAEQTVRSRLRESAALKVHSSRRPSGGRPAVTHLRVLRSTARHTLLEVRLATGRKHQIRAHLAELGHPIVGDRRYGRAGPLGRLALHAATLTFSHPCGGRRMSFGSTPPDAFAALVRGAARPPSRGRPGNSAPDGSD